MDCGGVVWRCQPSRLLGQLHRCCRRSTPSRDQGCVVECCSDLRIGGQRRQRKMTRALLDVRHLMRESPMQVAPLLEVENPIGSRREQRVGEANLVPVGHDHVRGKRRRKHIRRADEIRCRPRQRSGGGERLARLPRKRRQTLADERFERRGKRFATLEPKRAALERAAELERIERVAARKLMQSSKRRSGEHEPEPVAHEPVQRAGAEAAHEDVVDALERRNNGVDVPCSTREHERDRFCRDAARSKTDHGGGRGVEPLDVVDDDEDRAADPNSRSAPSTATPSARASGATKSLEQQRNSKSPRLRLGKPAEHHVENRLEQVADRRKCELRLSFDRTRGERRESALARAREHRCAQRRLPDSRFALDQQRGSAGTGLRLEERADRCRARPHVRRSR